MENQIGWKEWFWCVWHTSRQDIWVAYGADETGLFLIISVTLWLYPGMANPSATQNGWLSIEGSEPYIAISYGNSPIGH